MCLCVCVCVCVCLCASQNLERQGALRSLRVTNSEDIVPAIPNISLSKIQLMKHGGINLRLYSKKFRLEHSSKKGFRNALRNSIFKPIWNGGEWHSLELYEERFEKIAKELKTKNLDDLYKDYKVVSKKFIDGKIE